MDNNGCSSCRGSFGHDSVPVYLYACVAICMGMHAYTYSRVICIYYADRLRSVMVVLAERSKVSWSPQVWAVVTLLGDYRLRATQSLWTQHLQISSTLGRNHLIG